VPEKPPAIKKTSDKTPTPRAAITPEKTPKPQPAKTPGKTLKPQPTKTTGRTPVPHPNKMTPDKAPTPQHTKNGVTQPLERYFSQYSRFQYQPTRSPTIEFKRLCREYGWIKGDGSEAEKLENARHGFSLAMKKEFDSLYGSDEKDIKNWYKLCHVLRIDPAPKTIRECREVSS
jgi:hypothetical protein